MKVLYFTRGFSPHDRRFLTTLSSTEHTIHYLPLLSGLPLADEKELPNAICVHQALVDTLSLPWYRYPQAVRRFREFIGQIQPDLVHAGPIHRSAAIAALAGFHPLVSMSWGSDLLYETQKPWVRLAADYTLRRSDVFVGDCKAVQRAAIRHGMDSERIVLFPWGTDLEHFSPGSAEWLRQELGWEDPFVLISTRSFEPLYGVDIVVRAFIKAAQDLPSLRLLVLGDGSQRDHLIGRIENAGLSERVSFAGSISRQDLPDYYRTADLYLSASHSDGSSVSLLEAMACGLPALVSDIPGNREWVEPEVNGWLFRTGDIDSLVAGIRQAWDQRDRLDTFGKAGRRITEQRANWSGNFPRLLEAYRIAQDSQREDKP